MEEIQLF